MQREMSESERVHLLRSGIRECLRDAESRRSGHTIGNSNDPDALTALILGLRELLRKTEVDL